MCGRWAEDMDGDDGTRGIPRVTTHPSGQKPSRDCAATRAVELCHVCVCGFIIHVLCGFTYVRLLDYMKAEKRAFVREQGVWRGAAVTTKLQVRRCGELARLCALCVWRLSAAVGGCVWRLVARVVVRRESWSGDAVAPARWLSAPERVSSSEAEAATMADAQRLPMDGRDRALGRTQRCRGSALGAPQQRFGSESCCLWRPRPPLLAPAEPMEDGSNCYAGISNLESQAIQKISGATLKMSTAKMAAKAFVRMKERRPRMSLLEEEDEHHHVHTAKEMDEDDEFEDVDPAKKATVQFSTAVYYCEVSLGSGCHEQPRVRSQASSAPVSRSRVPRLPAPHRRMRGRWTSTSCASATSEKRCRSTTRQ